MVVLSTIATVIASQAVISGAFSLTQQAIQLGYSPRFDIHHTSAHEKGQVYIPEINWMLMVATVGLVFGFRTSTNLAAAYGMAVTTTMVITTMLAFVVARERWGWSTAAGRSCVTGAFLVIDLAFFGANVIKIEHGGWFPLAGGRRWSTRSCPRGTPVGCSSCGGWPRPKSRCRGSSRACGRSRRFACRAPASS